ncbi:MAG: hypothetical protein ACD_21C00107G0018 [uncultured bacterium]|nr:MAG: hypothetical protein ACD_21C00107G0018 [uncultured bacterium]
MKFLSTAEQQATITAFLPPKMSILKKYLCCFTAASAIFLNATASFAYTSEQIEEILHLNPQSTELTLGFDIKGPEGKQRVTTQNIIELLDRHQGLQTLNLSSNPWTTDEIGPFLGRLTQLRTLNLSYTKVTSAIGPHLANLRLLQGLNLNGNRGINDDIGPHLAGLNELLTLDLTGTRVTDAIGQCFVNWKQLQKLILAETAVTDGILEYIDVLEQLRHLDLQDTTVTDAIGPHLVHFQQMQYLSFDGLKGITDVIGPYIAQLRQLHRLYLWNTQVSDQLVNYLAGLYLVDILVKDTRFTEEGKAQLGNLLLG